MTRWRVFAVTTGAIIAIAGLLVWIKGSGPLILAVGVLVLITAALEPIYGRSRRRPVGEDWSPTDERFIDPPTGEMVNVWFNASTGERRYVQDQSISAPENTGP